jgi:hypothetical protein
MDTVIVAFANAFGYAFYRAHHSLSEYLPLAKLLRDARRLNERFSPAAPPLQRYADFKMRLLKPWLIGMRSKSLEGFVHTLIETLKQCVRSLLVNATPHMSLPGARAIHDLCLTDTAPARFGGSSTGVAHANQIVTVIFSRLKETGFQQLDRCVQVVKWRAQRATSG